MLFAVASTFLDRSATDLVTINRPDPADQAMPPVRVLVAP